MEESINKNNMRLFGYTFSIETALVVSIFSIGIVILIIGLIIDSKSPHIKKPIQRNFQLQTYNTKNTPINSKSNNIIDNKIGNSTNNIEIESVDKKTIKNTLVKIDSNYSKDDKHVYFGQQEQGNSLLNLNKDKIKIVGDYITDGNKLYNKSQEIQLGDSNIDLNSLQNAGQTYLKDKNNVYAIVTLGRSGGNKLEKVDININQMQFFLDGEWEYIKDNNKVYYLRGELYIITTLHGKIDKNGIKQWSIEGDTYRIKGQLSPMKIIDKNLIDFIKNTSSVYIKEIKKIDENYSTDGKKLYYTIKGNIQFEIKLGNSNIDLNNISMLGKYYIRYKNNIYSIRRINSNTSGITKLDLNINDMQFLSGQYEYINYNKNKITTYYEYIKDKNKVYYMRGMNELFIVGSISKQTVNVPKPAISGTKYPEGEIKLQLNLLTAKDIKITSSESRINKKIIDFVSGVVPMKEIK